MPPLFSETSPRSQARDRANVVAAAIIGIIVDALRNWLHGEAADLAGVRTQIESLLRDEFADIKREISGERIASEDP